MLYNRFIDALIDRAANINRNAALLFLRNLLPPTSIICAVLSLRYVLHGMWLDDCSSRQTHKDNELHTTRVLRRLHPVYFSESVMRVMQE